MAHTYTPGLRVTPQAALRRRRQLPLKGEILVSEGERVRRDQVVAKTELPGNVTTLNLVNRLGATPSELPSYMLKGEGDPVEKGEPLAETCPFIKWFKTTVSSPITGKVESVSAITGQVLLREPPRPVQVHAYVDGNVVEVIPDEGVVIGTSGAFIQGIFGVGGEYWGPLHVLADASDQALDAAQIDTECEGRIVVAGGLLTLDGIRRAQEVGAVGVIGGGIRDQDLRSLLGADLGVAITGAEEIGLAAIVTEGFGEIAMAKRTFELLKDRTGREASISGATQIRAGVMRPEIIIPDIDVKEMTATARSESGKGLSVGAVLRAIRAPYFGRIGKVTALPAELQEVDSGAKVRVLEVEFDDGGVAVIPRANVELIAE